VRKALSVWKYDHDREVESVIHGWLSSAGARMAPPVAPFHVCPVPLHEKKKRQRGFDQASVVAKWAGALYGLPVESFLIRTKSTLSQARLGSGERQVGELDGLFVVPTNTTIPEHVLLCDDVFTSGATMDAAARALKEAGAKQVWGWVIARGG
jgi:predicted amidophosphoribosyltransferase